MTNAENEMLFNGIEKSSAKSASNRLIRAHLCRQFSTKKVTLEIKFLAALKYMFGAAAFLCKNSAKNGPKRIFCGTGFPCVYKLALKVDFFLNQ